MPSPEEGLSLRVENASRLLAHFAAFLTLALHTLLYHRNLYPEATFLAARAYGLPVRQSRHPGVCRWVADAVAAVVAQLHSDDDDSIVERVVFAVHERGPVRKRAPAAASKEAAVSAVTPGKPVPVPPPTAAPADRMMPPPPIPTTAFAVKNDNTPKANAGKNFDTNVTTKVNTDIHTNISVNNKTHSSSKDDNNANTSNNNINNNNNYNNNNNNYNNNHGNHPNPNTEPMTKASVSQSKNDTKGDQNIFAVLERWVFDISNFPVWPRDDDHDDEEDNDSIHDDDEDEDEGKDKDEDEDEAMDDEGGGFYDIVIREDDGDSDHESATDSDEEEVDDDPIVWEDVDEALRGALGRLATAAEALPRLPGGCPFTLAIELRSKASNSKAHSRRWISSQPPLQVSRRRKRRLKRPRPRQATSTKPIRSVQAGPLFFECWVEKNQALLEKIAAIEKKNQMIREKNQAAKKKNQAITKKTQAAKKKTQAIKKKSQAIKKKNREMKEKKPETLQLRRPSRLTKKAPSEPSAPPATSVPLAPT